MKLSFPLKGIGTTPGVFCTQWFGEHPDVYSQFGLKGHNGIDWGCPVGTPIYAPHDGDLSFETETQNFGKGYGMNARLFFNDGQRYELIFGHLSKYNGEARPVKEGDLIGYSGDTGFSTGPHLHFGVRLWNDRGVINYNNGYFGWIDPKPLMKILIRFVGWRDTEKGIYLPFDSMDRLDEVFDALPTLKDYQFEEHEHNLGKKPFPDPFAKA